MNFQKYQISTSKKIDQAGNEFINFVFKNGMHVSAWEKEIIAQKKEGTWITFKNHKRKKNIIHDK